METVLMTFSHRDGAEFPRAYIVKSDDIRCSENDIVKWLALRVTRHKRLTGGVRFLSNLPRNASGKLLRKALHAVAADENVGRGKSESKL
jgi:4-coumarate--CoA ligase